MTPEADRPPPPPMDCAVCHAPLNLLVDASGERWVHGTPKNHTAVAVPRSARSSVMCDFCSRVTTRQPYTIVCAPFLYERTDVDAGFQDDGAWACCDICISFIRAEDWDGLLDHALHRMRQRYGRLPAADRHSIAEIHGLVRRHFMEIIEPTEGAT